MEFIGYIIGGLVIINMIYRAIIGRSGSNPRDEPGGDF
jgi:formate/nitrite transporter FocA (FNT family)